MTRSTAIELGLYSTEKPQLARGVGGVVFSASCNAPITIGSGAEIYALTISIQIIETAEELPILLGRKGFFDAFDICIHQSTGEVSLTKVTP